MPFRISQECYGGAPATFRLAGRLAGDAVEVLMDACVDIGAGAIIDLSDVFYADDAGVRTLGKCSLTAGSTLRAANGARSADRQPRRIRRSVLSKGVSTARIHA